MDLGYRGNNLKSKSKVYTPYTKKSLSFSDKKMLKRRSAIEPIIGHLKHFGRTGRNYLRDIIGDIINPFISAIGESEGDRAHPIWQSPEFKHIKIKYYKVTIEDVCLKRSILHALQTFFSFCHKKSQ